MTPRPAGGGSHGTEANAVVRGEVVALHPASRSDGSWTLGTVQPQDGAPPVAFLAVDLPPCLVGSDVTLSGVWRPRPGGGRQLEVRRLATEAPRAADAVVRYLVANLAGGRLGPKRARRIVDVLGADCLARLERDPDLVREVFPAQPAVAEAAALAVRRWAAESKRDTKARELAVRLLGAGVGYGTVRRITGYFHTAEAAEVATLRHPYRLVEVPGIGWATADGIARLLGADPDDPRRYDGACRHVLAAALREGHTGLPEGELRRRAATPAVLGTAPDAPPLAAAARRLAATLECAGGVLLDPDAGRDEWAIAEAIGRLRRVPRGLSEAERAAVAPVLAASGLTAAQRQAVWTALGHGTSVLTGRPGSGKTTTLRAYLACCRALGWPVQVVAPTGKAASRAAEVTGVPASTVHRLLGGGPGAAFPTLRTRALVVEEASMCDAETAAWLLSSIDPRTTSVLWTGDADQLPSVGPGQVLADLVASDCLPVARLAEVHRQAAGSRILANAHRLLDGEPLDLAPGGDWHFEEVGPHEDARRGPERVLGVVRDLAAADVDPAAAIQVLAPVKRGALGVEALNAALQRELNPGGAPGPLVGGGARVRLGDRVVMTRNAYDLASPLYNGEQGMVVGVDPRGAGAVAVRVDAARTVELAGVQCRMLALAWAVTVHRAQGSECAHAVLLYDERAHARMLDPRVLYTAMTRARVRFTLVGTREAVRRTQAPGARRPRHTGLAALVRTALGAEAA